MAKRRAGLHPLAYMGVNPITPPQMMHDKRAPLPTDNSNVTIGTIWVRIDTDEIFMLTSLVANVATWTPLAGLTVAAGVGIDVTTVAATSTVSVSGGTDGQILVGATGGFAGWTNITSTGGTVSIAEGANTLNLEATGVAGLTQLDADTGSATPVAGAIMIAGGTNITTSAATDTVTITLDDPLVVNSLTISGLTTGVLVANAGGVVDSINGTDGQLIIAGTGLDPIWANVTSAQHTIQITEGPNTLNLESYAGLGSPYIFVKGSVDAFVASGDTFEDISYDSNTGTWVCLGGANIATSTDLITWTLRRVLSGFGLSVHCNASGECLACAGVYTYYATDPTGTWTERNFSGPSSMLNRAYNTNYAAGYWLRIGTPSSISAGKMTWTTDPTVGAWSELSVTAPVRSSCYSTALTLWVVVGDGGYIATATNPDTGWTQRTSSFGTTDVNCVDYSPTLGLFVAGGEEGTMATSPDGITWTQMPSPFAFNENVMCVIWDSVSGVFIAESGWGSSTMISYNGFDWSLEGKWITTSSSIYPQLMASLGGGKVVIGTRQLNVFMNTV